MIFSVELPRSRRGRDDNESYSTLTSQGKGNFQLILQPSCSIWKASGSIWRDGGASCKVGGGIWENLTIWVLNLKAWMFQTCECYKLLFIFYQTVYLKGEQ